MDKTIFKTLEQLEQGTPKDKLIVLKSVFKTGKTTVQPVTDGLGWYKGVPRLSEDDKKALTHWAEPTSKFVIKNGTTFDLTDEAQKLTWDWVKYSPCIAINEEECQFTPGAEFFIFLENEEAQKSISRRELKFKAMKHIMDDAVINYPLRASLFGVNMDGDKPSLIKDFLLEEAERDPQKIMTIYESHDLSYRLLFLKSTKKGILVKDGGGIYRYGNTVLGMTEASCISWMQDKDNKHLLDMLEREVDPEYFVKPELVKEVEAKETAVKVEAKVSSGRSKKD